MDEVTDPNDCQALIYAGWCGVSILATAHASDMQELMTRPVYKPLIQSGLFEHIVVMREDKSWSLERINRCS